MQPLVEELIPCPDPWHVARKLAHLPHLLFLDSAAGGRYSYVMADPIQVSGGREPPVSIEFVKEEKTETGGSCPPLALPPFRGGLAGFIAYDCNRCLERIAPPRNIDFQYPDMFVGEFRWVVSFDHCQNRAWIIAHGGKLESGRDFRETADHKLRSVKRLIHRDGFNDPYNPNPVVHVTPLPKAISIRSPFADSNSLHLPAKAGEKTIDVSSNFSRDGYLAAVRKCIDYIHAGDAFQINLSQRLLAPLTEHPLDLYGRLRQVCPAPFSAYFDAGDFQILSASPERFLQVTPSGEVSTKPIKGTRPRGKTKEEDEKLIQDLLTNPKDRAENVMIVDLLRNDLGRVCEYGSIHVPKVCELETHSYVHHLVSEVRGQLRKDQTPFDLLRAAFPGGSVTGAPKVQAMEIIAELEPTARGPYCGSLGFIGFDGAMDTNILIRTMTAARGWLQFPVGGGIVADSDPETEYEETLHKAAGMLKALKKEI